MKKFIYLVLIGLVVVSCSGTMRDNENDKIDSTEMVVDSIEDLDSIDECDSTVRIVKHVREV